MPEDTAEIGEGQSGEKTTHGMRVSFAAKARSRPTTARMKRMLKAYGVTVDEFTDWMGWDIKRTLAANPTWTERQWVDLLVDNRR